MGLGAAQEIGCQDPSLLQDAGLSLAFELYYALAFEVRLYSALLALFGTVHISKLLARSKRDQLGKVLQVQDITFTWAGRAFRLRSSKTD